VAKACIGSSKLLQPYAKSGEVRRLGRMPEPIKTSITETWP